MKSTKQLIHETNSDLNELMTNLVIIYRECQPNLLFRVKRYVVDQNLILTSGWVSKKP